MFVSYISLGSNLGERLNYLKQAVKLLKQTPGLTLTGLSAVYETDPVGYLEQDNFLNACARLETDLLPTVLLARLQEIENILERTRTVRWGPRTIDLDLLTYDEVVMNTPYLELPHPRLKERLFVLIPLAELNSKLILPGETRTIAELLDARGPGEAVRLYLKPGWAS